MPNWWSFVTRMALLRRALVIDCAVAEGEEESESSEIATYGIIGLIVPSLESTDITFKVNTESGVGDYALLKDIDGSAITISATTGGFALSSDELTHLAAYRWIKIVLSAAQSQRRVFKWVCKS